MKNILRVIALCAVLAVSCSKKEDETPEFSTANLAPFSIEFDNIVGDRTLALNHTSVYKNAAGEPFSISRLQYFISNIKVTTASGKSYTVPQEESYFLINGADKATRFAEVEVPEGDYTQLEFTLGIDSLRSTMDLSKRTGVLDPAAGGGHDGGGMYWGWNSGYIFFKFEGNSAAISDDTSGDPTGKKQFKYHIGGFGGYSAPTLNNIKTIKVDLSKAGMARVRKDRQSNVHLFVDIMKVFNGKNAFSIAAHPNVMFSAYSVNIANNLQEMFRHDHTEN